MDSLASKFKRELKDELSDEENVIEMETDCNLEEGEISDDGGEAIAPLAEVESTMFDNALEGQSEDSSKRFALIGDMTLAVPKQELQELYDSLGIDKDNERHYKFNTVHIRGAEGMKTKDIFDYLSGLEPVDVSWLSDGVCNVQWNDEILPARTLLYLSVDIKNIGKRIKLESGIIDSESSEEEEITGKTVDAMKLKFMLPPGKWRKGVSSPQSRDIIMRYANKDDKVFSKKHNGAYDPRGYYNKHGKRSKHSEIHVEDPLKNPWGPIAQSWGKGEGIEKHIWPTAPPRDIPDLRDSLNDVIESRFTDFYLRRAVEMRRERPPAPPVLESSNSSSEDEDESHRRRKLPQMHADREEAKLRMAKMEASVKTGDLRSRLNQRKIQTAKHPGRGATRNRSDESSEELSSEWATEGYYDIRNPIINRIIASREDSLASDSDLEFGEDEPGEMLQIEIDNEYFNPRRRRKQ